MDLGYFRLICRPKTSKSGGVAGEDVSGSGISSQTRNIDILEVGSISNTGIENKYFRH